MSASAKYKTRHFLAYSKLDALLIAITIAHFAIILWAVSQFSSLPILYQLALGLMLTFLILTQYHVVMHNFIHTRFFGSQALNRLYAILCTITTMNVFTEAEIQHLTHHVHVNDRKDTATGVPKDPASTFRYGADGNHENILSYSILSPIREIFELPEYSGRRVLAKRRIVLETSSLWIFWLFVFVLNWRFGVFYMGVSYVGQVLSSVQNYFEHYGATPGNRKADSVSCYGRLYNLVWFKNGYHQEHHFRPAVHWSRLPQLRSEMLPAGQRHIVEKIHCFNFPHHPLSTLWGMSKPDRRVADLSSSSQLTPPIPSNRQQSL